MTPDRQRRLIFTVAGVMGFLALGAFGFLVWRSVDTIRHPTQMTPDEKRLLITTETLEPVGVANTGHRGETIRAVGQIDGTRDLEYTYTSKNDPQAKAPLYVLSKVQVLPMTLTAKQVFKMEQLAIRAGVGLSGKVRLRPQPELVTFGEQSYAACIERDGRPAGNLFVIRQGRVVHTFTIGGFYFEKAETVERLFAQSLSEAKRQFD